MVTINISIRGDKEVNAYLAKLPVKVRKEVFSECSSFMKDMYQNMVLRAPDYTGFLKSQLNLNNDGKSKITIDTGDAYYAIYQEIGFQPHIIPLKYISQHRLSPATSGVETTGPFITVSKNTPFIGPAFEKTMAQINSRLDAALTRAMA